MLVAKAVRKTYGGIVALEDLNLTVESGSTLCLLGANGAGKSTTMNLFLGFTSPDSGSIEVDGLSPSRTPEAARRKLSYIPENVSLYPALSGLENLRFFDQLSGHQRSDGELTEILVSSGLIRSQVLQPVAQYSKGMKQKVGLAIAFAKGAKALLLDEPLSGLDPKASSEFTGRLRQFQETGCAVLMATHDIFRAKECASTIGIMRAGQLVELLDASQVDAQEIERIYLKHMREDSAI